MTDIAGQQAACGTSSASAPDHHEHFGRHTPVAAAAGLNRNAVAVRIVIFGV